MVLFQTCIYEYGSFYELAGYFDYYNIISHPAANGFYDTFYRNICCDGADNTCELYHEVRPDHTCNAATPYAFGKVLNVLSLRKHHAFSMY